MSGLRGKRYRRPELPLVPLIDVLVMLVLFSFVTMRFDASRALNITVPKVTTAGKNEFNGKIEIAVDKDGNIIFNGKQINERDLDGLLAEVHRLNRDTPVLVRADEGTQFKKVTEVWDACRKLGLNNVVMQTRK